MAARWRTSPVGPNRVRQALAQVLGRYRLPSRCRLLSTWRVTSTRKAQRGAPKPDQAPMVVGPWCGVQVKRGVLVFGLFRAVKQPQGLHRPFTTLQHLGVARAAIRPAWRRNCVGAVTARACSRGISPTKSLRCFSMDNDLSCTLMIQVVVEQGVNAGIATGLLPHKAAHLGGVLGQQMRGRALWASRTASMKNCSPSGKLMDIGGVGTARLSPRKAPPAHQCRAAMGWGQAINRGERPARSWRCLLLLWRFALHGGGEREGRQSIIAQGPAPAVVGVMARGWPDYPAWNADHQRHDEQRHDVDDLDQRVDGGAGGPL